MKYLAPLDINNPPKKDGIWLRIYELIEEALVEIDLHRLGRTGYYAKLAGTAFIFIKCYCHLRSFNIKGPGRTNCCASTTMKTFLLISLYILAYTIYLYAEIP